MTTNEATQALTMGDALEGVRIELEILKSLPMPRPKKEKQAMVPVRVSPRNSLCTKLSMEEKEKVVTIEIDEEEEDLEDLIIAEDEDKGMEEEIEPVHPLTKLPTNFPPWKGKARVPKDLDCRFYPCTEITCIRILKQRK